jgi:hypothetical protein
MAKMISGTVEERNQRTVEITTDWNEGRDMDRFGSITIGWTLV